MSSPAARSLADQLRGWPDERLTALLRLRPDLATPTPHDSGQLAARAATRASLLRALEQLTRLELSVLDALVVSGQTSLADLQQIVNADPGRVAAALTRLDDLLLAWATPGGWKPVSGVADLLAGGGPELGVSGVGPLTGIAVDADAIATLTDRDREQLEQMVSRGSRVQATGPLPEPVQALVAAKVLRSRPGELTVPGETGLALRGGRTTTHAVDDAPELATAARDQALVDRTGAGAAFEVCRRLELLLDHWSVQPPAVLRQGGLGVRDLKATARMLHVDEPTAGFLVELAQAAGLVATWPGAAGEPAWVPTVGFDEWLDAPLDQRWVRLARAWLASTRISGLVGEKDASGKTWNALSPELSSLLAAETRQRTLDVLLLLEPGQALAAGTGVPSVVARAAWERPRRPSNRGDLVTWSLREAAQLGITGLDGLTSFGRALALGEEPALAALLPSPVEHVLIQADLTAVAPGPLTTDLARQLAEMAEVESRGGATVYRFTPTSIRRALDLGWTASELQAFVAASSRTPVPQPLDYLITDTARTHGTLRMGYAEAYLRSDDETALAELLSHPRAGTLGLRRIAPTVLVSSTPPDVLLARLRDLGAAPVVEGEDGGLHLARPDVLRSRPRPERGAAAALAHDEARLSKILSSLRTGDQITQGTRPLVAADPATTLTLLRDAARAGQEVVITYVDAHGASRQRLVKPLSLTGGTLRAHDLGSDDELSFAVHRISAVGQA